MVVENIDVLVIGGGVTGCYVASKLKKRYGVKKIVMIEASKALGGRLYSEEFDKKKMTMNDEIGALRFFPTTHKETKKLLTKAKARTLTLAHNDKKNMFSYQGKVCRKIDAKFPGNGRWKGKSPKAMQEFALKKWKKTDKNNSDPFVSSILRKMNLQTFFEKFAGVNDQEFDYWIDFSAGDKYVNDDVSAAHWVQMMTMEGTDLKNHYFVRHGYGVIANKLVEDSEVDVRLRCKATTCRKIPTGKIRVDTNDPRNAFIADQVFVCLTVPQIHELGFTEHISPARRQALNAVKTTPIFRINLAFKEDWWHPHGLNGKKTTTDKAIRSIHYYDDDDILIHAEGKYAEFWEDKFRDQDQMEAYNEVWNQMRQVHEQMGIDDIPEPEWKYCAWAYWPHNHVWGTDAEPNARACMNLLAEGSKDGSKIYICGEAYSDMQGWVEGCFHSAKTALKDFDEGNAVGFEQRSRTPERTIASEVSEESCCICCGGGDEEDEAEELVADTNSYTRTEYTGNADEDGDRCCVCCGDGAAEDDIENPTNESEAGGGCCGGGDEEAANESEAGVGCCGGGDEEAVELETGDGSESGGCCSCCGSGDDDYGSDDSMLDVAVEI